MSPGNDAYCGPDWTARDAVRALEARVALLEGRARVAEALPAVTVPALTGAQRDALEHLEDVAQDAQAFLTYYAGGPGNSALPGHTASARKLREALAGMAATGFPMRGADAGKGSV